MCLRFFLSFHGPDRRYILFPGEANERLGERGKEEFVVHGSQVSWAINSFLCTNARLCGDEF